jgi:endonuclease-3 related protein
VIICLAINKSGIFTINYIKKLGPQHWWPADSDVEMLLGMVLVQNTNWNNAAKALKNISTATNFQLDKILNLSDKELEKLVMPSGYYHNKAKTVRNVLGMYQTSFSELKKLDTDTLREKLLAIKGVGEETADVMLLYLFNRPVFVADNYTRKFFSKYFKQKFTYASLRKNIMKNFAFTVKDAQEFHALLDVYGKQNK